MGAACPRGFPRARFLTAPERLLVFSGFRGKIFNTVFMHSPQREGWQQPSRMLTPRIDCAAVQLDAHQVAVQQHCSEGAVGGVELGVELIHAILSV